MNLHACLRPFLALCTIITLPSCTGVPGEYGGYGGSSYGNSSYGGSRYGGSSYGGGYDDGPGYSSYQSRPSDYSGGGGYYGGNSYRRPSYGNSYYGGGSHYSDNHDRHDHDSGHRSSSSSRGRSISSSSSSDNDIRLVKVRDGTRGNVPEGYHSKEWYQKRGISVSKNTYETRDGDRRGYTGSSSKSKSNSKKKKD